ncbi:putative membrane-bound ClpP-class protease associated with aq_911 [Vibrio chagasii]|uniref:NfeD family protein n=1 Tax=Vibrio chagasii TaxID=170679 RepID=UPI00163FBA58|nr:nodulation protein NfeD [Vibrio chagasii]CAH6808661.1 putative membrane-bound ClpP-class protease associated with aq_911 [Vibrio chagasii]CAH6894304.1 putative membrane-bound ClpP-class protease associated with aq_911 [Vibrio chagasii]CAH6902847.1 putative membrane-bound ClpP-class protease associated with aq_911 [Vibrio chagasii]CAH6934039.1 putative membrane-bound ClpP-class protease associated with aq_911 [Vibrio chagasii]CAH6977782.1 putative membrane-bound ClpP-class protease associate
MTFILKYLFAFLLLFSSVCAQADDVWVIEVNGGIGPATSDYLTREIEQAHKEQAKLIILKMNTPGGLDTSMRDIIRAITTSPVPVATWVGPAGSRAASAGTYILLASHIASMAPGTNLGAATPVSLGGGKAPANPLSPQDDANNDDAASGNEQGSVKEESSEQVKATTAMEKKVINDAAAYIVSLAKLHNRNEEWAEKAVREAASLDSENALELNVIDFIASDLQQLVEMSNGRTIMINGINQDIELNDVAFVEREQDWRFSLLSVITNPNVAYILMLIGIYGLLLEFYNPGVGLPGVLGGICLVLAMYSLQMLPVSYAGLALILLGIALMVAEAFSPSFGIFGLGGVAAFSLGSIMLMDTEVPGYQIALPLIIGISLFSVAFIVVTLSMLARVRSKPVTTGMEAVVGETGKVISGFPGAGRVLVAGEIWQAQCTSELQVGQSIRVTKLTGLSLDVEALSDETSSKIG